MKRDALALYVITDAALSKGRDTLTVVRRALEGGADAIQLREKMASSRELVELGRELKQLTREFGALLIVNDRVDVALAVDADGVHVGQDDMPADIARRLLGQDKILGVSAATPEEARKALADGADYLGVGAIYGTASKADAGAATGPQLLDEIRAAVALPLVAIGGVNCANAGEVIAHGADGIAVISAVVSADNVTAAARELKQIVSRR